MSHKKQILEFSVSRYCIFFPSACLIFITVIYKDITKEKERRILTRNCCITLLKKSIFNAKEIKKILASYQSVIWDRSEMALPWVIIFQKYVLRLVEKESRLTLPDSISASGGGGKWGERLKDQPGLLAHVAHQGKSRN